MLEEVFGTKNPVIGVIHLLPLPGSHRWDAQMEPVLARAEQEAAALASGGVNAILVENFFDMPFTKGRVDTACACAMTLAVTRVQAIARLPVGVNVLRNDALSAMAIAAATGACFIRVNVHTGAMLTDQGLIEGNAHELLSYRRQLGAERRVRILADVMVKHAWPLDSAADIGQYARDTAFRGLADAIIVSGAATGLPPDPAELHAVRDAVGNHTVLIGSGTTNENCASLLAVADGIIVASSLKRQGKIENPVDVERVRSLVNAVRTAKASTAAPLPSST
jgi:uncharacterized protein